MLVTAVLLARNTAKQLDKINVNMGEIKQLGYEES